MSLYIQELESSDGVEESFIYKVKNVFTKAGAHLYKGKKICELTNGNQKRPILVKAKYGGIVSKLLIKAGDEVIPGKALIEIKTCTHPTVLGNICCDCGLVLEEKTCSSAEREKTEGLVSMLHSVPDLKVSQEEATKLGKEDIKHLLDKRKLVLLVDLDQTLIHTTNDNIPPKLKDVFHFQLVLNGPWYHTRLRPFTVSFLNNISELYELHICTFGVRQYAHCIAKFLDPDRNLFRDRILSRNECLDPMSKKANLSSLFPCGDNLVCIIDDRSDVWNFAPNVVQVMPYHFFKHTGDINAPPELQKKEQDDTSTGFDFSNLEDLPSVKKVRRQSTSPQGKKGHPSKSSSSKDSKTSDKASPRLEDDKKQSSEDDDNDQSFSLINSEESSSEETNVQTPKELNQQSSKDSEQKSLNEEEPPFLPEDMVKKSSKDSQSSSENIDKPSANGSQQQTVPDGVSATGEDDVTKGNEEPCKSTTKAAPENTEDTKQSDFNKPRHETLETSENPEDDLQTSDSLEDDEHTHESYEEDVKNQKDTDTVDVEDSDDYLLYLEDILKKLHTKFYELHNPQSFKENDTLPDLKDIVPSIRKKVLAGVHLVLSGIIPQHTDLKKSKVFHIADSLGAKISEKIIAKPKADAVAEEVNYTTHLIATNLHTEKVHQAKRMRHIKIVTPNWLWCCAERWEKVDERLFVLTEESLQTIVRAPPMHCIVSRTNHQQPTSPAIQSFPAEDKGSLFNSLNPLAFLTDDEAKSMEEEVDSCLSDEDDHNGKPIRRDTDSSSSSSDSEDDRPYGDGAHFDDYESSSDRKRRRVMADVTDDDGDNDDYGDNDDDELPSIRFRQGDALPSDDSDQDSGDEDFDAYGDILARELMKE